ncbi:DUF1553 domain-containing protein [Flavisolibacter ginsengisoli]|jgi:hypothetical protein|uniref:Planctomycete cytochrome C n=1 Tax=Flavisolibacter ginsengisoli DSM 18119 TaxID=1121884 RepID=A0A1M5BRI8_9BACT|nr:DUF1553 domain-containing protein [Flavisolibacter ginsengisoli]SHF45128.1 Planctomycete cytochrome C [Flavisolibacter ginsengisoli DSM 18119]
MKFFSLQKLMIAAIVVMGVGAWWLFKPSAKIDFSTEVKPILNKKCITCHGGVRQKSGFSLLFRDEALAKAESGKYPIVPGDPNASELVRRIHSKDPEERMPYHSEPLSEQEINILTEWIKQGAQWGEHWAYVPVQEVALPKPSTSFFGLFSPSKPAWVKNDIDYFIYDQLQQRKLDPSPVTEKPTLLRRVSMDLTGLPPSDHLAQQFLQDNSRKSYENLVDSLLASPAYGERWTAMWMDLARYADTKGYERDANRDIWHYRDWLIKAFNADKPYNEFLTEQIAGDLLPNATDDQFIATAFHRNTMTNDEGGTDNEEFRTAAIVDRVNTTWEALMGTTFACVQCHSHPYDPFKHDEYYKFMAFFNNSRDEDTEADYPLLRHFSGSDSAKLVAVVNWLREKGFKGEAAKTYRFLKTWEPTYNSLTTDHFINSELNDTKWLAMRTPSSARLKNVVLDRRSELIYRYIGFVPGGTITIRLDNVNGPVLLSTSIKPTKDWELVKLPFTQVQGTHDLYFIYNNPSLKDPKASGIMFDWFYFTRPLPGQSLPGYDSTNKNFWQVLSAKNIPVTPIMVDNPPEMFRHTYVFERGNWLVKGDEVKPAVPKSLGALPKGAPNNRLGLAQWLTDKRNPLTARTMVNRLWEQLFGTGLVETLEDMGTQGAEPTHRQLLDYLAWQFMNRYNWSIKKLLKELVLSATYTQDSRVSKEALEKDPLNKFYARGPRVRFSAEQVRDQALAVSGLLSPKMYGPSVMPWQPAGIWMSPWNGYTWTRSEGEDQYRRAIYTFWKRTAPYPSMISFDGVGREVCMPRRIRTNTPLQALVTLNDSVYLEASRYFAYRMQREAKSRNAEDLINKGYELAMYKPIAPGKLKALMELYATALQAFTKDKDKTCEMIGTNNEHNDPGTAALVVVANAILNLDELVTKS